MLPFVDDGHQRALDGIRAKIENKYAKQFKAATAIERKLLIKKIEAEIQEAMQRQAPPGACY